MPAAICPYCQTANPIEPLSVPQIVICDIEQGGCDRYFVAKVETSYSVSVGRIRFDGIPDRRDDAP